MDPGLSAQTETCCRRILSGQACSTIGSIRSPCQGQWQGMLSVWTLKKTQSYPSQRASTILCVEHIWLVGNSEKGHQASDCVVVIIAFACVDHQGWVTWKQSHRRHPCLKFGDRYPTKTLWPYPGPASFTMLDWAYLAYMKAIFGDQICQCSEFPVERFPADIGLRGANHQAWSLGVMCFKHLRRLELEEKIWVPGADEYVWDLMCYSN